MKNKPNTTTSLLVLTCLLLSCRNHYDLTGDWIVSGTHRYQLDTYKRDRASFTKDSITLASGFYYPVIDQNNFEEWQTGHYPYVYYGRKEKYKIVGDSLYIFATPYNEWDSFKIVDDESGELRLNGKRKQWVLVRQEPGTGYRGKCAIRYIKAHVYEPEGHNNYALNYHVTYSKDDKLVYEQLSHKDPGQAVKTFPLKSGTFADLCQGFDYVDVDEIQSTYESEYPDPYIELELGLEDGRVIKSLITDPKYPDELQLALTPVIHGHMRIVYPHLRPAYARAVGGD